jgi:hypothetical protein
VNNGLAYNTPVLTSSAALNALGRSGTIILLGGTYEGLKFDLSNTDNVEIRARDYERVKIMLGEKVNTFTNIPSTSVYYSTIATAIPANVFGVNQIAWVFEEGTPDGAVSSAAAHPLQKGKPFRMEHLRMNQAASTAALNNGEYFYNSGTLYLKRSDGGNPNGHNYWIPSQTGTQTFILGGNYFNKVSLQGIEIYYGFRGADFNSFTQSKIANCTFYGNYDVGSRQWISGYSEEFNNEYAANGSDGIDWFGHSGLTVNTQRMTNALVVNPWAHDNGDQGISHHGYANVNVIGGLLEYNWNGGILGGGGQFYGNGITARGNTRAGFYIGIGSVAGSLGGFGEFNNCNAEGNEVGYFAGSGTTRVIVRNSSAYNSTSCAFATSAGQVMDVYDTDLYGTTPLSTGAGTINFKTGGRYGLTEFAGPMVLSEGPVGVTVENVDQSAYHAIESWWQKVGTGARQLVFDIGTYPTSTVAGSSSLTTRFRSAASGYHLYTCGLSTIEQDAAGTMTFSGGTVTPSLSLSTGNLITTTGSVAINGGGITTTSPTLTLNN